MSQSYPTAKFFFKWYDFWMGAYYDRRDRRLFICFLPTLGVVFDFGPRQTVSRREERIKYFAEKYRDLPPVGYVIPKEDIALGGSGGVRFLGGQKYSLLRGPEADEYGNKDAMVWVKHSPVTGAFWVPTDLLEVHKVRDA